LGNLLANLDNADNVIGDITLQYVGIDAAVFPEIDGVTFIEAKDFESAKEAVKSGDATAAVRFSPEGIDLGKGRDAVKNGAIESIFRSISLGGYAEGYAENTDRETFVKTKDLGINRTMLDYYAVTIVVMIIFMGSGIDGATTMYKNRKNGIIRRTVICPKSRTNLYVSTVLASMPQSILQVICVMLASVLLFGAHYANGFADNCLLFFMFFVAGMTVNAVFAIVGMLVKVNPTMILMPIIWTMMFISGSFAKGINVKGVSEYLPMKLMQNAAFDLTMFGRAGGCLVVLMVCAIVLVLATVIGAIMFNRKAVVET
jgi:ABC-2 type transport system permease protein